MEIPDALIDAFKSGRVILFVGSGLSSVEAAGYPSASGFSHSLRDQVVADAAGITKKLNKLIGGDEEADKLGLDDIAEYFELFAGSDRLIDIIKTTFNNPTISATTLHRDLWELPNIRQIYTTNFDPLIEKGLEMSRVRAEPRVIIHPNAFQSIISSDYHVFKLHGCAVRSENRDDIVITKSDYMNFERRHPLSKLKAQSELMQNVFLFLGYSLADSDFQSLYREVRSFAGPTAQSCFAVIKDVFPAKVEYWKRLGLHILSASAEEAISSIKTHEKLRLHTSWFEWRSKQGAREDIKQAIAQKALSSILSNTQNVLDSEAVELTFILDSGTSTLAFARRLKDLLDKRSDLFGKVKSLRVITNCTAIADEIRWIHLLRPSSTKAGLPMFTLYVIGGKLRTETQALIPPISSNAMDAEKKLIGDFIRACLDETSIYKRGPVIAILGATAVNSDGFSTSSEQEVDVKKALIAPADQIFFLLDHSKFRMGGKYFFLSQKDAKDLVKKSKKIIIVTDRKPPGEVSDSLKKAGLRVGLISAKDLWAPEETEISQ